MQKTTKAFLLENTGKHYITDIELPKLKARDILVKNAFCTIHFPDVQYSKNILSATHYPFTPGIEGVGEIVETGSSVPELRIGQRIAYGPINHGSYAEYTIVPADAACPIPKEISNEQAACSFVKGMIAHHLMRRVFYVRPGSKIVITAAAGGVGHIITALGKHYGATIFAIIGNQEKKPFLNQFHPDHIILGYENYSQEILSLTNNKGVNVFYDSVGSLSQPIASLTDFGLLVSFGTSGGSITNFHPKMLVPKSLFFTTPRFRSYKKTRKEFIMTALEVFGLIHQNIIPSKPSGIYEYKFETIMQAHDLIFSRKTFGSHIISF